MLQYFFALKKLTPPLHQYSQLETMLALRKLGYSYTLLADRFGVEKTTIRYLCRKFGINTVNVLIIRQHKRTTTPSRHLHYDERDGLINPGKSYAQYLREEEQRKWKVKNSVSLPQQS